MNHLSMYLASALTALGLAGAAVPQIAEAQPSFRIARLYSSQDGVFQFIQLTEIAGSDNQSAFAGLALTVTSHGRTKTFVFPNDLPSASTAHRSVVLASRELYNDLPFGDDMGLFPAHADFQLPRDFLDTDGGTVDFAGADRWDYAALPVDGLGALERDLGPVEYQYGVPGETFSGEPFYVAPGLAVAYEFFNAALGQYFISASQPDFDALDSGRLGGWQRTGRWFAVAPQHNRQNLGALSFFPVCRYYLPQDGDHFWSASAAECKAVATEHPDYVLESDQAFQIVPPDPATGSCGDALPVYRFWNPANSGHRYVTDANERMRMLESGWRAEGYGPGVVFCTYGAGQSNQPF